VRRGPWSGEDAADVEERQGQRYMDDEDFSGVPR